MQITVPFPPQGAKRPRVNSKLNNAYYDNTYRNWLNDVMGWVEQYLVDTDFALIEELLGKDADGKQYRNTHYIRGFKMLSDVEYRKDKETGKKVLKTRNLMLDHDGQPVCDKQGYVLSQSGQRVPITGGVRDDFLGIKGRALFILPRRNGRKSKPTDRPFPIDSMTYDLDNYVKAIQDAFFETPMFKETGLNDRHITLFTMAKRYVKGNEKPCIKYELKPV